MTTLLIIIYLVGSIISVVSAVCSTRSYRDITAGDLIDFIFLGIASWIGVAGLILALATMRLDNRIILKKKKK